MLAVTIRKLVTNCSCRFKLTMSSNGYKWSLTRELVKDFVTDKLHKAGYDNYCYDVRQQSKKIEDQRISSSAASCRTTMRLMGDEFTRAYFSSFDDMTNSINIHSDDLKEVLYQVLDVTCEPGVEWGRIVGVFVFTAMLAVKAMDCYRTDVVGNLIQWTGDYLETNKFSVWIKQHGGWDGFVDYYKNPAARHENVNREFWMEACKVGLNFFTGVASAANFLLR